VWADKATRRYSDEYAKAHEIFHEVIAAGCGSPWLLHLRTILFNHSERYRWFSGPLSKVERDLDKEHREIADATLSRDSQRAVALMNEHLQMTAKIMLDAVSSGRAKVKPSEADAPESLPSKRMRGASSA
jgi:DNA-binding GntR family transcriptional regulator